MILEGRLQQKRFFDPRSKTDMSIAKKFMKTNSWGPSCCPFYLEYPYKSVPGMIKDKIVYNIIGVKL